MNLEEILIWESSNLLLLIPIVIGLMMLVRWFQGKGAILGAYSLLLFGYSGEKSSHGTSAPVR